MKFRFLLIHSENKQKKLIEFERLLELNPLFVEMETLRTLSWMTKRGFQTSFDSQ
jgi:hypothetical protein